MKPFKIVNDEVVQLIEGPYMGVQYQYQRVQLLEEIDVLRLKFEYNVLSGEVSDVKAFEQYIGELLHGMIEEKLSDNSIVYTGGVDAH